MTDRPILSRFGRAPSTLRGLLFDKDGTLFDFEKSWSAFCRRVVHQLSAGRPDLAAALAATVGFDAATGGFRPGSPIVAGAVGDIARLWADVLPDWTAQDLELWLNREAAAMDPRMMAPAASDLADLLAGLAARGLTLGVATNDAEAAARSQLAAVGALDRFAFIAGYDSGYAAKPAPDMLLGFAESAGLPPSSVAMVGDSPHDLIMARRAGAAAAVGVLTGPAGWEDLEPFADAVLPSIAALPDWLDGAPTSERAP